MDAEDEELLRRAYEAFNERDVDAALETMHPDVEWPNAWEGGRVSCRDAVAAYWLRQFAANLASRVEPLSFEEREDGSVAVTVAQVVDDAGTGERLSEAKVVHIYRIEDGLIRRMDVLEPA